MVRTPRRVFIMSLKTGQANVIFLDGAGRQISTLDVNVEPDVAALDTSMLRHLPDSGAHASAVGESVVVRGNVRSAEEARRAQDLATRYAGSADHVVNVANIQGHQQVMIKVRVSEMSRTIAKQLGVDATVAARHVPPSCSRRRIRSACSAAHCPMLRALQVGDGGDRPAPISMSRSRRSSAWAWCARSPSPT